jgi:hypothetical protein
MANLAHLKDVHARLAGQAWVRDQNRVEVKDDLRTAKGIGVAIVLSLGLWMLAGCLIFVW